MSTWLPIPNASPAQYRCVRHPDVEPFGSGRVCSACLTDPPPPDLGTTVTAPRDPTLPTALDHERTHLGSAQRIAKSLAKLITFADRRLADASKLATEAAVAKGKRQQNLTRQAAEALAQAISAYNAVAKLEAETTRKLRAATELTRWREDWANTEQLEDEVRELKKLH